MASFASLQSGELLKLRKLVSITDITKFPAMQIQYCGPKLYAKVAVAAGGDITVSADDTDGTTADVTAGFPAADGVFDVSDAACNTFWELAAKINASPNWRCYLIGVLGSASCNDTITTISATHLKTGATAGVPEAGLTLTTDAAVSPYDIGFAITNQRFYSQPSGGFSTKHVGWAKDEFCDNSLNYLYALATVTSDGVINVYSCDDVGLTETLMWTNALVTATAEEHNATSPWLDFMKAVRGHRLLVYMTQTSTNTFSAPTFRAHGTTKHVFGEATFGANYTGCV